MTRFNNYYLAGVKEGHMMERRLTSPAVRTGSDTTSFFELLVYNTNVSGFHWNQIDPSVEEPCGVALIQPAWYHKKHERDSRCTPAKPKRTFVLVVGADADGLLATGFTSTVANQ